MTQPRKVKPPTREELLRRALHPGPGALGDGSLALRATLFAEATSRAPGKAMTYGAQAKAKAADGGR